MTQGRRLLASAGHPLVERAGGAFDDHASAADPDERLLAVVLHDVAPATWPACVALQACVREVAALPLTLLAVPRYHGQAPDAGFERSLTKLHREGHELALHGYTHRDDGPVHGLFDRARRRWYTDGEGEFAVLNRQQALQRLRAGRRWFRRNGWPLRGFVAPAWLSSAGTWEALHELDFDYACTLSRIVSLRSGAELHSRSIVYSTRSAWRRTLSLPWNAMVERSQRRRALLRFELHPGDAMHPAIRKAWMHMLERALRDRRAVTLSQVFSAGAGPQTSGAAAASPGSS